MLDIVIADKKTGKVNYAVVDVSRIRYITPSEIGFAAQGRDRSCSFTQTEQVTVSHVTS